MPDLLAAVGALAELLQAIQAALDGQPDEGRASAAAARLAEVLGPNRSAAAAEGAAPALSIDDAAALLIRLEPHDQEGWRRLEAALVRLANADGCRPAGRDGLNRAARLCREAAGGVAEDLPAGIARIGELLDDAMNAMDLPEDAAAVSCASAPEAAVPSPVDNAECLPANLDPDLMAEFINESSELIQNAEEALLSLEHDPEDIESVGKVFRAFHTVKGTAGFLDLTLVAEMGHHAETLLSRVRDGEIRYSGGYADLTLQALDMIKHLVTAVKQALAGAPLRKPEGYDALLVVLKNPEAAGISQEQAETSTPRVGDILVAQGKAEREQVEQALSEHPDEKAGVALVKSQAASVADVSQALRAQKQMRSGGTVVDSGVRVSTQRLDRLIDMVGELVIAHSMVAQDGLVVNSENHGLAKKVVHTSKIVRELQDISMSMRMVPLKATFSKMARLARDVSRKLGKNVNFVTDGEDTEIDRNLVDIINDPLVHMVRNAVDHGSRDARRAPGGRQARAGHGEARRLPLGRQRRGGDQRRRQGPRPGGAPRQGPRARAGRRDGGAERPGGLQPDLRAGLLHREGRDRRLRPRGRHGRGQEEHRTAAGHDRDQLGEGGRQRVQDEPAADAGHHRRHGDPGRLETYVMPTISIIRSVKPAEEDISTVFGQGEMLKLQGHLIPLVPHRPDIRP